MAAEVEYTIDNLVSNYLPDDGNILAVHSPLFFKIKVAKTYSTFDLVDVYFLINPSTDNVQIKPYELINEEDATHKYYIAQLDGIMRSLMPSFDYDNAETHLSRPDIIEDFQIRGYASYDDDPVQERTTDLNVQGVHKANQIGNKFGGNANEVYLNTHLINAKIRYWEGFPFDLFWYADPSADDDIEVMNEDENYTLSENISSFNDLYKIGTKLSHSITVIDRTITELVGTATISSDVVGEDKEGEYFEVNSSKKVTFPQPEDMFMFSCKFDRQGKGVNFVLDDDYLNEIYIDSIGDLYYGLTKLGRTNHGANYVSYSYYNGTVRVYLNGAKVHEVSGVSYSNPVYQIAGLSTGNIRIYQVYMTDIDVAGGNVGFPFIVNPGENNLKIADPANVFGRDLSRSFILNAEYHSCNSLYLRWLDDFGMYRYWMFDKYYVDEFKVDDIGEVLTNFTSLDETDSYSRQIGSEIKNTRKIKASKLSIEEYNYLLSIIESPCVYLFTGKWGYPGTSEYWVKVMLDKTSISRKTKSNFNNIELNIILPKYYTVKL